MPRTITALLTVLALGVAVAGCGSSSHSSATASSTTTESPTPPAGAGKANAARALPGSVGAKGSLASLERLPTRHRASVHARFSGLGGLTLTQKLEGLANNAASFWAASFQAAATQLAPATVNVIDQTPGTCGSSPIATTDPPQYCVANTSIELPLAFIQSNVAPIGDAALALLVSDLYGYHIENQLGAFGASSGMTPAALLELDSCLSGSYFYSIEGNLTTGDQAAVNKLLAEKAGPPGSAGGTGATVADLTTAFNKGILGDGKPSVCLSGSGGTNTTTTP